MQETNPDVKERLVQGRWVIEHRRAGAGLVERVVRVVAVSERRSHDGLETLGGETLTEQSSFIKKQ